MKKLLFLILFIPSICWAQFATTMDSSDVAGWNFSTFTDIDDSLKAGYQIFQKIDTTDAVIDSAVGAERAAIAASVDEAASSVWAGRVSDETGTGLWVFGTSPTFTTDITSPFVIGGTATTSDLSLKTTSGVGATGADMHFLVGNNGATEAMTILNDGKVGIGTATPSSITHIKGNIPGTVGSHPAGQLIIQNPTASVLSNVVITAYDSDVGGAPDQQLWYLGSSSGSNSNITFLNRRSSNLHLGTNGITRMTIDNVGKVGIGTTAPPQRLSVIGNIAAGDTATGDTDVYHYFSTDGSWVTEYFKWDDGLSQFMISDDLDITGNITVNGNAYHVTSTETDSQYMSKKYIDNVVSGGGSANADSIKSIPIQDTTGNIGDGWGLTFDDTKDSLLWTEFWATPISDPTDNYVLKIDTDPDPDTFYWAADETGAGWAWEDSSGEPPYWVDSATYATVSGKADSALAFTHQGIKKYHIDSTSENFVFDGAYHRTSAEAGSAYVTTWTAKDAIGDTIAAHWSVFTAGGDPGAAIDDSIKNGWQIYQKIDTCNAVIDSAVGAERAAVATSSDTTTAEFLHRSGGTMTGNITMPDDAWIGVSADSVRMVFDSTGKDLIKVSNGKLRIIDNNACLELEDDGGNEAKINVGNSQLCLAIDPDDLVLSSDICFDIDGDEVARFHQSTNFGIGTLSPSERLSVEGNAIITGRITSGDTLTKSFVIASIDDTFDFPFWQTKRAITIVAVSAVCTGGTNVIGALQEYNATGTAVDAAVDADWTILTTEFTDASFTNPGIDAGDWLGWKTTSVSGSVTFFSITFEYTEQ